MVIKPLVGMENSRVDESKANGRVESAIQRTQGQIRALEPDMHPDVPAHNLAFADGARGALCAQVPGGLWSWTHAVSPTSRDDGFGGGQ